MKFTTVTIPAVEMTRADEHKLHKDFAHWKEHGILDWNTDDGNNEILFEGETAFRVVVHPDE